MILKMVVLIIRPKKAVQPPIPVTLDMSWLEHQQELACLMEHGVAVQEPAHVRMYLYATMIIVVKKIMLTPKLGLWQTAYIMYIGPLIFIIHLKVMCHNKL